MLSYRKSLITKDQITASGFADRIARDIKGNSPANYYRITFTSKNMQECNEL